MGGVSHHSVLLLCPGAQKHPGLILDVENPQLAGDISCGVDLSPIHVDLPLDGTKKIKSGAKLYDNIILSYFCSILLTN